MAKKFDIKVNAPATAPAKGYDGILAPTAPAPVATSEATDNEAPTPRRRVVRMNVTFALTPDVIDKLDIVAAMSRKKKQDIVSMALESVFADFEADNPHVFDNVR